MRLVSRLLLLTFASCLAVSTPTLLAQSTVTQVRRTAVLHAADASPVSSEKVESVTAVRQTSRTAVHSLSTAPAAAAVHPLTHVHPYPSGPSGPIINAVDFGAATVAGQPVTMSLTYTSTTGNLTIQAVNSLDFVVSSVLCSGTQCTAQVSFTAQYPGLRRDTLIISNGSGTTVAKTFVHGTGMGPQYANDFGGGGGNSGYVPKPAGVAIGPDEVLYLSDQGGNAVYRLSPTNGGTLAITGLGTPLGVAVSSDNTVYVVDQTNNHVVSFTAAGIQSTVPTSVLSAPSFVAVDGTGALYITDTGNGRVLEIDNQGTETVLATGLNSPTGIAVDAAGDVYYADQGSAGEVTELPAGGGAAVNISTSLGTVTGIAVDAGGRVYYGASDHFGTITPGCCSTGYYGSGPSPLGVALSSSGGLYTTTPSNGSYSVATRGTGGNFILSTPAGTTASGSQTVENSGNTPLSLTGFAITGTTDTIDQTSSCVQQPTLAPGYTCDVVVNFTPPAAQDYTSTATVTSNSLNAAGTQVDFTVYSYGTGTSTTSLVAMPTTATAGQTVTLVATVGPPPGGQVPTGSVTFLDGTTSLGTVTLSPNGNGSASATLAISTLAVGSHSITANYGGDSENNASTGTATVTISGSATPTTTVLTVSPATLAYGQAEMLTASIQGSTGAAPTGTVSFFDQAGLLGMAPVAASVTSGTASLTLSTLSIGSHTIVARYSGDASNQLSASGSQTVTVNRAVTTATLSPSPSQISFGQTETLTASFAGIGPAPATGTFTFADQNGTLGSDSRYRHHAGWAGHLIADHAFGRLAPDCRHLQRRHELRRSNQRRPDRHRLENHNDDRPESLFGCHRTRTD